MNRAQIVVRSEAVLGEGSVWDDRKQVLYWLDIVGRILYIYNPETGVNRRIDLPGMPGTVVPRKSGGMVLALEDGIHLYDPETGVMEKIGDPEEDRQETRYNDGKCDPSGRFWVGTMGRNGEPGLGSLYRVNADRLIEPVLSEVDISNGIVWSPDRQKMYWTDTLKGEIYAFDYDDTAGTIVNKRVVLKVGPQEGLPDGMSIDAEGLLWVALWDGGKVIRIDPDNGTREGEVRLPVRRVTSCAFGGPELRTLYITTARMGLSDAELREQPQAGSLFSWEPGVTGMPSGRYAG